MANISFMIPEKVLIESQAGIRRLKKGQTVFYEGDSAHFYFQVKEGQIKMTNLLEDGREFILGIFGPDQCFGEPPVFDELPYPANAVAVTDAQVWVLDRQKFFDLLIRQPELHFDLTRVLCNRLRYKSMQMKAMTGFNPEQRIATLLDHYREKEKCPPDEPYTVTLTRQQIADLTGLRVETVIRTLKNLEKTGRIKIENRKVIW